MFDDLKDIDKDCYISLKVLMEKGADKESFVAVWMATEECSGMTKTVGYLTEENVPEYF